MGSRSSGEKPVPSSELVRRDWLGGVIHEFKMGHLTGRPKYRTPLRAGQGSSARGVNQPAIASLPAVFL